MKVEAVQFNGAITEIRNEDIEEDTWDALCESSPENVMSLSKPISDSTETIVVSVNGGDGWKTYEYSLETSIETEQRECPQDDASPGAEASLVQVVTSASVGSAHPTTSHSDTLRNHVSHNQQSLMALDVFEEPLNRELSECPLVVVSELQRAVGMENVNGEITTIRDIVYYMVATTPFIRENLEKYDDFFVALLKASKDHRMPSLYELAKFLKEWLSHGFILTDSNLFDLAHSLTDLKKIAFALGVKNDTTEHIKQDKTKLSEQIFDVLVHFRNGRASIMPNTISSFLKGEEALKMALDKNGRNDLIPQFANPHKFVKFAQMELELFPPNNNLSPINMSYDPIESNVSEPPQLEIQFHNRVAITH